MVELEPSVQEEEEAMDRLFPWHCYKNNLKTFKTYRTLQALCLDEGIDEDVVQNAIKHNQGNWGAYHFVQR